MPRFSINVSFMLTDYPFLDRFAVAADLGFRAVDIQFPYDTAPEAIIAKAEAAGVEIVLHNLPAGDRTAGDLGLAAIPGREQEFRAGVRKALAYSKLLGNRRVNILAGVVPADVPRESARQTFRENLVYATELFGVAGLTVMIEPANSHDLPGFFLQTAEQAADVIALVGATNLKIQLDLYHCRMMGADPVVELEKYLPLIDHIQFADAPGRHQPGTGEIDFTGAFSAIDRLGYGGWVGAEYSARGALADSLGWMEPYRI
ncbi:MAG: TIM barrel protein [Pseudomonadota bacterium]